MAWLPVTAPSALTKGSLVQQLPQLVGAALGQGIGDRERAAQPLDVGRRIAAAIPSNRPLGADGTKSSKVGALLIVISG